MFVLVRACFCVCVCLFILVFFSFFCYRLLGYSVFASIHYDDTPSVLHMRMSTELPASDAGKTSFLLFFFLSLSLSVCLSLSVSQPVCLHQPLSSGGVPTQTSVSAARPILAKSSCPGSELWRRFDGE